MATEFINTAEAAERHNVTQTWVKKLARDGLIPGAVKLNQKCWAIPADWTPSLTTRAGQRRPGSKDRS
jgi:hypothetical protein